MQLKVGPPLAGAPFFEWTRRLGDKRQPYTVWFSNGYSQNVIRLKRSG